MTPDNRQPRKRRRRSRRAGAPGDASGDTAQGQPNGNIALTGDQQSFNDGAGGGAGRRRRNRSRRRGGHSQGYSGEMQQAPPIDLPAGELAPVSGVLWIKPNGTGLLVQPANNYVPTPRDAIVPRPVIERLHLLPGLLLAGSARRAGNNLEFVGLEQVEGMALEEYREARRPFSELVSIDPSEVCKLETQPERPATRVIAVLPP